MRILIVGAGPAGASLASFLKNKPSFDVTLIERAPEFRTIGYAVGLVHPGQRILQKLGVYEEVKSHSHEIHKSVMSGGQGGVLFNLRIDLPGLLPVIIVPRESLLKTLVNTLKGMNVRFNTTVKNLINREDGVSVTFNNDQTEEFDLVVAADGIRSTTREMVFGPKIEYTGWAVWVSWVYSKKTPKPNLFPEGMEDFSMKDHSALFFNGGNGVYTAGFAVPRQPMNFSSPAEVLKDLKHFFRKMNPLLREVVDSLDEKDHILYDDLVFVSMKEWYRKRVCVIGDARHGMPPHSGLGTTLALEDAFVLSEELIQNSDLDQALEKFQSRRQKRVGYIEHQARILFRFMCNHSVLLEWIKPLLVGFAWKIFQKRFERILRAEI